VTERRLTLSFAFLIPILFTLALPYTAGDLAIWIAQGNFFLQTHQILRHDIFSILQTGELVYPSFGISVVYALLYRAVGLLGVCLFHDVFVLLGILFLLYRPLIKDHILPGGKNLKWFLFLFWLGGVPTFVERPAMVALLPLIFSFQLISKSRESFSKKEMGLLLATTFIWANIHGSFILLPLMLGWRFVFGFKNLKNKGAEIALGLGTLLVSLLNPFGWKLYPYLIETSRLSKSRGITEWDFPGVLTQFPTGILFWLLFFGAITYCAKAYQQKRFLEVFSNPFFLFLLLGTTSIRNAALAFILILPAAHALGFLKTQTPTVSRTLSPSKNLALFLVLLLALPLTALYKPKRWDQTVTFELSQKIKSDGRYCPIFSSWELGSFLALSNQNPIYLDTRNIIYSQADFEKYEQTLAGNPIAESFLADHKACFVLVSIANAQGLITRLKTHDDWQWLGDENGYTLYKKKPPEGTLQRARAKFKF
jgi:hypothetical protein